jgi:hypothetical protein
MNTITDELNILKSILDLIEQVNSQRDFMGKDEVDSRLRWAAKNVANKVNHLSNLER